ncbi:hypothetical protein ACHAW6_012115 [Cyclotella cf. meneghiniana]
MVNYGVSLRKARRPGWEDAYLDYEGLKDIRNRLEALLVERDDDIAESLFGAAPDSPYLRKYFELRGEFAEKLHSEIEKVSLFSLNQLGEVANAVGVLRFMTVETNGSESPTAGTIYTKQPFPEETRDVEEAKPNEATNYDEFGDKGKHAQRHQYHFNIVLHLNSVVASLLPASDRRSVKAFRRKSTTQTSSTRLFSRSKLGALVGRQYNDDHDKISIYSDLGVELLHILKYTCVNAAGIRKIGKKYAKLVNCFPITREADDKKKISEVTDLLMPKEVAQNYATITDSRIGQLTNNKDFATIFASLLDALEDCEKAVHESLSTMNLFSSSIVFSKNAIVKFLLESEDIPEGTNLLRFECTMSSIHTLMEFSQEASRPFQVFLSKRAMINAGKDKGELGNAEKKALALLLEFEPDFILDMSERELRQWYIRATSRSRKVGASKTSSAFIDFAAGETGKKWGGVDARSMTINLASTLLYTVNYYIIAPTANHYAILLGQDGAYGATLIGASSFSAIFAAFFYSVWYTRSTFWTALAFSALCPLFGNLLYSVAITYDSMKLALLGRLLCGMGSAECVNRQLISACVSYQTMTKASALFVSVSAAGMSIGPLIAAILDMSAGRDEKIDVQIHLPGSPEGSGLVFDHVTMPGFLMAFLWGMQVLSVFFLFDEPERINSSEGGRDAQSERNDGIEIAQYGSISSSHEQQENISKRSSVYGETMALFRVILSNMAFPVTLYLFACIELSGEVLISSCSMIVRRYFHWHGSRAGFIIASLGALVLPAHFIVERASRSYSERQILKYSILFVMFSCVAICNLEGLALDFIGLVLQRIKQKGPTAKRLKKVVTLASDHGEFPYDWGAGSYVYLTFLSAIFIGSIIMEGVNTSLMSKTAPAALNDSFVNMGLLATLVGTLGRVVGDSMITISAFIGKSPLYDFVSVTFLPLLPILGLGLHWVSKVSIEYDVIFPKSHSKAYII